MEDKERVELLIKYLQELIQLNDYNIGGIIFKSIEATTKEIGKLLIK